MQVAKPLAFFYFFNFFLCCFHNPTFVFVSSVLGVNTLTQRSLAFHTTFWRLAKVAIFTTNVDAENQTLFNRKCVCGALNRHFCRTPVSGSLFSIVSLKAYKYTLQFLLVLHLRNLCLYQLFQNHIFLKLFVNLNYQTQLVQKSVC